MHLIDQRLLGIGILFLLAMLVVVKRFTTGSILDKPKGSFLVQLVNVFNLFFLLVVNPAAAVLLVTRRLALIDFARVTIHPPWLLLAFEIIGLLIYVLGFLLMAWALIALGRNYQLGGSSPRSEDRLVEASPYRLIRHPMYTSALSISLGLTFLVQSWVFLGVFAIYLVLILLLVPLEEEGLRKAFGEAYASYRQKTRKLVPFIF